MRYIHFIFIVFLFFACNRSDKGNYKTREIALNSPAISKDEEQKELAPAADSTASFSSPQPGEPQQTKQPEKSSQSTESKPDWNKKIIKTAALNVEVKDYQKFDQLVHAAASRFGGYIADEQQTETGYKIENSITIKVPVDQFQTAVDFLTTGDGKINEKKISSEDVTTQYVDTKSRLEAKRQVRLRYLDLLKQAKNMEEILQVQNEINEIQEEIESAAGRINYLSNASAMSTINLTFYQVVNASAKDVDHISFWAKTKEAFVSGWNGLGEVLVGIIYIWPLLIGIAVAVFLIKRISLKKKTTTQV